MPRLFTYLKNKPYILILILILAIATFFRTYKLIDRFDFAHDGDLYSWIVRDIVVNHHLRLIGQETTAPGIFIGPFYYYMLIPFFLLFNMDPVGSVIPITIIGILTVLSYYLVFVKLFNKTAGLVASFLQATLLAQVWEDRRVVPSTPTNIWTIWYFFTVVNIARGNFKVLPLLGILIGLIWHIHIALLPALIAVPVAFLLARKIPTIKEIVISITAFLVTSIPFFLFEARHHFSQTLSFISDFSVNHGGGTGLGKLNLVIIKFSSTIDRLFFYPQGVPFLQPSIFVLLIVASAIILFRAKLLSGKEVVLFYIWILGVLLFYSFSSSFISEYYFSNLNVIFLGIVSLLFAYIFKKSRFGKYIIFALLVIILVKNTYYYLTVPYYHKGYQERKALAKFISQDSKKRGFPCVSVSYITSPGENVGFRYFFWLNKLHVNQPKSGSPVYTIVLPQELAQGKNEIHFGQIKIIPPEKVGSKEEIEKSCSGQDSNLTNPMFGFTK